MCLKVTKRPKAAHDHIVLRQLSYPLIEIRGRCSSIKLILYKLKSCLEREQKCADRVIKHNTALWGPWIISAFSPLVNHQAALAFLKFTPCCNPTPKWRNRDLWCEVVQIRKRLQIKIALGRLLKKPSKSVYECADWPHASEIIVPDTA